MNLEFIFKIIDKDEWQKAKQTGTYGGSKKDVEDGYIHFSEEDQVEETLRRHYPKKDNLLYGRGTCDMKGFIASTIAATEILKNQKLK